MDKNKQFGDETICIQGGYDPKSGEPRVVPISMSTTFKYDTGDEVGDLFDLKAAGFFYTRLANPTTAAVEAKIAQLEGGVGAMITASGMSAIMATIMTLAQAGDRIIASHELYGGTLNLFAVTLKKFGIEVDFVNLNNASELEKAVKPNTKAVFGETLANPALTISDLDLIVKVAHKHGLPVIMDATFTPAVMLKPISYGVDIVIHSTSKYMDGHAMSLGGVVIDSGKFDWAKSGRFDDFTTPDDSYHGVIYTREFGEAAFIAKARVQMMRDTGPAPSPFNAFLLNVGLETLHLRMPRHSENALKCARFLKDNKKVKSVNYPALEDSPEYQKCQKYLKGQGSGVIGFDLGTRDAASVFMQNLKLAKIAVHVADARTCVLHPASSTHRQLSDLQLQKAGINPGTIRLSVGIESVDDILADLQQALLKV